MVNCLNLPEKVVLPKEYTCTGTTMLLVELFRLPFPTTLLFMERVFGIKIEKLSRIFNNGIAYLHDKFRAKLNLDVGLLHARKDVYSLGISDKCGNLLQHCMGFIDATQMRCCRPIVFQEAVYNGHKRAHGLKFQSIVCPDGMIGHLFGPVEGLTNIHNCFHANQISQYFGVDPPSLEEYLSM